MSSRIIFKKALKAIYNEMHLNYWDRYCRLYKNIKLVFFLQVLTSCILIARKLLQPTYIQGKAV
jgi:hypothetical protein